MKDSQRELEDSRASNKEVLSEARESERRARAMEAEILHLHEVYMISNGDGNEFKYLVIHL